mgnify:FL=1
MKLSLNIARASGIFQLLIFYFGYLFSLNIDFLLYFLGLILNNYINKFLKYGFFSIIFGKNNIPLLGKGIRPKGAKNCCWFKPCDTIYPKYPKSYGMPSGHSQSIAFFSTLGILFLLNRNISNNVKNKKIIILGSIILVISTLFVMYSRVLFKCHTIEQTIVGALIGIFLAFLLFNCKNKIKNKLKKYSNYELYLFLIATAGLLFITLK